MSEVELLASETVEPYGNLIPFACLSGLRQGELFALRDRAVDLTRSLLLSEAGAREGQIVQAKTSAGRRQVGKRPATPRPRLTSQWVGEGSRDASAPREDGWQVAATRGSHRQLKHPEKPGRVTVAGEPASDLHPRRQPAFFARQA